MNTTNEVGFLARIKEIFERIIFADRKVQVTQLTDDGNDRVFIFANPNKSSVVMDKDWCIPIKNMKYYCFSLVVEDKSCQEAEFKSEQIDVWKLSNDKQTIVGPFSRKTCDIEYLNVYKMKELLGDICSVGTYTLTVYTKSGVHKVEVDVVDVW